MQLTVTIDDKVLTQMIADAVREALAGRLTGQGSPSLGAASGEQGYAPSGVGKSFFFPVDDGSEWQQPLIDHWVRSCNLDGIRVLEIAAKGSLTERRAIDPRDEMERLGWHGIRWAGIWNGPRSHAGRMRANRGIRSWPYGHTSEEPRRIWMHPVVAERVLKAIAEWRRIVSSLPQR